MAEELDRREMLEAALEQAEEGTLEAPVEKEIEVNDDLQKGICTNLGEDGCWQTTYP